MKKSNIYIIIGAIALQFGACAIHYGLCLMLIGAFMLFYSYMEYNKEKKKE